MMNQPASSVSNATLQAIFRRHPGVAAAVLFGSRGRGDAAPSADWDLGFIPRAAVDGDALRTDLVLALGTDQIDLVDLAASNGVLRYRAARDGQLVYEGEPGIYELFWLDAVGFWCDARSIIAAGHEAALERLGP